MTTQQTRQSFNHNPVQEDCLQHSMGAARRGCVLCSVYYL